MRINVTEDLNRFIVHAGDWLVKEPVANNVLLNAIATQRAGHAKGTKQAVYGWAEDGGGILGAVRWPPPLPATLTAMPEAAASALAAGLMDAGMPLAGVNGPSAAAAAFASRWQELTAQRLGRVRELIISRADEIKLSEWPEGRLRHAAPAEVPQLAGWITTVLTQAGLPSPKVTARQQIDEQLADGRLFVWEDNGQLVAVTGHAAPVAGVALVFGGFASPEHRTSWYGTAVVAAVSAHILEQGGDACIAITDGANVHSSAMLRAIGYLPVATLSDYQFLTDDPA